MHYNQVAKWRRRYLRGGLGRCRTSPARAARQDQHGTVAPDRRSSHPSTAGRVRWTCRAMARELGVSKATVQRVSSQTEIKPHLSRVFKLSIDPILR